MEKDHHLIKKIDTKLDTILSHISSRGLHKQENTLRTNSSGKSYTLDMYSFGNKSTEMSAEDLFLKKMHDYRAIHQKSGYTEIITIPEESIPNSQQRRHIKNKTQRKFSNPRATRNGQQKLQSSTKNNRTVSTEPYLKDKPKALLQKQIKRQSISENKNFISQKERIKNFNSEKKINLSSNKVDSSFFQFKDNEKLLVNPMQNYVSSKKVFLNQHKNSDSEKLSRLRYKKSREYRKNAEENSNQVSHPLIQIDLTKKQDPRELREKYIRQYIHFQEKPRKKTQDYSIITLGDIQIKNQKIIGHKNHSMIEKNPLR